ncbi:tetraspanin-8-like, partial [Clarias magur]
IDARTEVIALYVTGSIVFCIAVLGAYGAHKESKCTLIVFFIIMCLVTASMLCIAIQLALNHTEMRSLIGEYIKQEMMRTEDQKQELSRFQERNHCCRLFNGSRDWRDEVPDSCNCVNKNADDTCETVSSRSVWSKKCGPILTEYVLVFLMAVLFSLPALA